MDENEKNERLREIAGRFCDLGPTTILGGNQPPFDATKPNLHDSKAEFLEEKQMVTKAALQAEELFEFLAIQFKDDHPLNEVSKAVCNYVDRQARASESKKAIEVPSDLVKRNAIDIGVTYSMAYIVLEVAYGLKKRELELKDQEAEFWSGSSRPPNHYARTIALRFARFVAQGTGKMPTVGTARDGGHPSTDFGRALEEIFDVLDISADFRRAANWAVEQLTADDLKPAQNSFRDSGAFGSVNRLMGLMEYAEKYHEAQTEGGKK